MVYYLPVRSLMRVFNHDSHSVHRACETQNANTRATQTILLRDLTKSFPVPNALRRLGNHRQTGGPDSRSSLHFPEYICVPKSTIWLTYTRSIATGRAPPKTLPARMSFDPLWRRYARCRSSQHWHFLHAMPCRRLVPFDRCRRYGK